MKHWDEPDETTVYIAVVNDEGMYSIWPAERGELPIGWREAGMTGTKRETLAFIEQIWSDLQPLSLRQKMEEDERRRAKGEG